MRIHPAFNHTIATTPEWKAWQRQCEIDQTYNVEHCLKTKELTPEQLADFIQYSARQHATALLLECESMLDISWKEMNSVVNNINV